MNVRVKGKDAAGKLLRLLDRSSDAGVDDEDVQSVRKQLEDIVSRPENTDSFLGVEELDRTIEGLDAACRLYMQGDSVDIYLSPEWFVVVNRRALPRLKAIKARRMQTGAEGQQGRGRR